MAIYLSHTYPKEINVLLLKKQNIRKKVDILDNRKQPLFITPRKILQTPLDKMISCYTCRRKTNRWTVVIFSNALDSLVKNAYILFQAAKPVWKQKWQRRLQVLTETVATSLVQENTCFHDKELQLSTWKVRKGNRKTMEILLQNTGFGKHKQKKKMSLLLV